MRRECKVEGCVRPTIHPSGMCCTHATMQRHGKPLLPLGTGRAKRRSMRRRCSVEGCREIVSSRDMCARHYQREWRRIARAEAEAMARASASGAGSGSAS